MAALLLALWLGVASAEVLSETSKDLGHGFRRVTRSETMPPGHWEGVGHFVFFYFRDIQLSRTTIYSIAPDGRFALFQDGPTGDLVLFRTCTQEKKKVHEFGGSLVDEIEWAQDSAKVSFRGGQVIAVELKP